MKNKIMGILALASCVVLSGCGEKDIKIEIKDIPTDLLVGSTIDLKDYITVSGGEGGYSINFDDDSFSKITRLSSTELQLDSAGSIKFTVDYSGKSVEGIIPVGSKLLSNFLNDSKDVKYNYSLIGYDDYGYPTWLNFGEKYYADYCFSDDGTYYIPGGYLEAEDGNIYTFVYNEDWDGLEFSLTGNEPDDLSLYSMKFEDLSIPKDGYEAKSEIDETTGEAFEYLTYSKNDNGELDKLVENFFGYDVAGLRDLGYEPAYLYVAEDALQGYTESGEDLPAYYFNMMVTDASGKEWLLGEYDVAFADDAFFDDVVIDFIDSKEAPKSKYQFNVADVATACDAHNFKIDYSCSWYNAQVSDDQTELIRGKKLSSNPFVDSSTTGKYINEYLNATSEFSAYVTENQTFVENPSDNKHGMIQREEGHGWTYSYDGDTETYKGTKDTEFDLYHEANYNHFDNYSFLSGADLGEGGVYDTFFVNDFSSSTKSGVTTNTYYLTGKSSSDLFYVLFAGAVADGYIDWYVSEDDPNAYKFSDVNTLSLVAEFLYVQGMEVYLDTVITETIVDNKVTGMYVEYTWIDAVQSTSGYAYYEYVMSANITFGGAEIPSGVDVVYPVA